MPSLNEEAVFTGPEETVSFAGILSDMDGTIIDSTDAIVKHWHKSVTQVLAAREGCAMTSHNLQNRQRTRRGSKRDPSICSWQEVNRHHKRARSEQS